jgi:hypothetical protein
MICEKDPIMNSFFTERDWKAVRTFWSSITVRTSIPQFIMGDMGDIDGERNGYGVTDLQTIHKIGMHMYICMHK